MNDPSILRLDQFDALNAVPNGTDDFVGRVTLTVAGPTAVLPEPVTVTLLGAGLLGLRGVSRWRRAW